MIDDGLWDVYENFHMGMTAELVAEKYNILAPGAGSSSRSTAIRKPFARENRVSSRAQIVPVEIPQKKGDPIVIQI